MFLFEAFGIFIFGLMVTYLVWIFDKKKRTFQELFYEHGYALGVVGALITIIIIAIFRSM